MISTQIFNTTKPSVSKLLPFQFYYHKNIFGRLGEWYFESIRPQPTFELLSAKWSLALLLRSNHRPASKSPSRIPSLQPTSNGSHHHSIIVRAHHSIFAAVELHVNQVHNYPVSLLLNQVDIFCHFSHLLEQVSSHRHGYRRGPLLFVPLVMSLFPRLLRTTNL